MTDKDSFIIEWCDLLSSEQNLNLTELVTHIYEECRKFEYNNCKVYGCEHCMFKFVCENGEPFVLVGKYKITIERLKND